MNDSAKTSARAGPIKLIKWTMAEQNPVGWGRKGWRDRQKTEGWARGRFQCRRSGREGE